jgi:uncharacterized damage-inducible protein DinB
MAAEGAHIAGTIERILRRTIRELRDLPDEALNRELDLPETNTLFQMGTHIVGSTRYWTVTLAGGTDYNRDRSSEFRATGTTAEVVAALETLIGEVHASIDGLGDIELERPTAREDEYATTGVRNEAGMPLRDCLLHALEHVALHLGHIQITRQLLGYAPPASDE